MEKLIGMTLLAALLASLGGCSDAEFTAEPPLFTGTSQAGSDSIDAAGEAGAAPGLAGASGAADASAAGQGGASGGAGAQGLGGSSGESSAAGMPSGGAPALTTPPCTGAIDAPSHGYLALQSDTCYRTPDVFNTLTCGGIGWSDRTIRVNGALATCNAMGIFPPPYQGYSYIEIVGGMPGADWLRWSESE